MSRNLPEFPNLEHLKKQAKSLLRKLRQRSPDAKLTDAQYEIARDYGFPSWNKLKAHVESTPQPEAVPSQVDAGGSQGIGGSDETTGAAGGSDSGGMFVRFTERARRVIFFARYWAGKQGSAAIDTAQFLRGLLQEDPNLIKGILGNLSLVENALEKIDLPVAGFDASAEPRPIPLSNDSRRILQLAASEADGLGHRNISTGHFWLACLHRDCPPQCTVLHQVLHAAGVPLEKARSQIVAMLNEELP